jgi:phage shock protein B
MDTKTIVLVILLVGAAFLFVPAMPMSPRGMPMSTQTFVLAIIFMVVVVPSLVKLMLSSRERRRHSRAEEEVQQVRGENAELLTRLDELEERIRVLERIVTDDRYELRRRFRDLGS